ncbi:MAG: hypothetical protein K6G42_11665 [Lachnospiraceae bacterium]|nr:hypothetical protein [Lachnospiraceae bacterium]
MQTEKPTEELNRILGTTHPEDFETFYEGNIESLSEYHDAFHSYVKMILKKNGLSQQDAFLNADVPERYGYKLLSGEKHTRQRDVILRICFGANMTLEETQKALKKYGMPELYPKIPRDALLMTLFRERPASIIEINRYLTKNKMAPLKTSGVQE